MAEFRLAPGVDPIEPREETVLSLITYLNRVLCGAHIASRADGNAVGNHEVNELSYAGLLGSLGIVRWNNHLRQVLDHLIVLRREE